jgi:hypothetical protein
MVLVHMILVRQEAEPPPARSKAEPWNEIKIQKLVTQLCCVTPFGRLQPPVLPVCAHLQDNISAALVITGAGVTPMNRQVNITSSNRVIMNIGRVLAHHDFSLDKLGVIAFLPELKGTILVC